MLRYEDQMPKVFAEGFLKGLQKGGVELPDHWKRSMHLLNLGALLDCLTRAVPDIQPKRFARIIERSNYILKGLETYEG